MKLQFARSSVSTAFALTMLLAGCASSSTSSDNSSLLISGSYTGTYSGGDSGALTMTVTSDGYLSMSAKSTFWHTELVGSGTVGQDNHITVAGMGNGAGVTFTFTGTFIPGGKGAKGEGSWTSSNGGSGSWDVAKN